MTQFTSFVAVEKSRLTIGGKPVRRHNANPLVDGVAAARPVAFHALEPVDDGEVGMQALGDGLVDVALATSAAPGLFPLARIGSAEYLDGGTIANAPDQFLSIDTVSALKTGGDLQILWFRCFSRSHQSPKTWRIGCERFLHEDVDTLFHGVFQLARAEGGKVG